MEKWHFHFSLWKDYKLTWYFVCLCLIYYYIFSNSVMQICSYLIKILLCIYDHMEMLIGLIMVTVYI